MKKIYFIVLISFLFSNYLFAQTYPGTWVSLYQDSAASNLTLSDMAVDANGNTYLCGYEIFPGGEYYQTHLCLIKVNAAGKTEWKRNFNTLNDSIDAAIAIAVDSTGNIYITGKRIDTFCNICTYSTKISDIITMKYNANGNRIWLNRYHDSVYILAEPSNITLSSNGTIIITGNERKYVSQLGTYVSKMLVQKINNNGKTIWLNKTDSIVGNAACFDNHNNIIIAAASNPDNLIQTQKPMVLKYASNGNLLWSTIYNEPGKNGSMYFVQCDSADNIYANGQTDTLAFFNNPRIITIRYNKSGRQRWARKEADNTTTRPHFYGDFKADASGNCYLTGFITKSSGDDDWITTSYSSGGSKKWSNNFDDIYHGSDKPIGLAIDKKGNTHVTGYVYSTGGNYAIATVHYNKTGALLDSDIYVRNRSNGFATGIGVDKNGNVYTGGAIGFYTSPYPVAVVIKYSVKENNIIAKQTLTSKKSGEIKLFPNPVYSELNIQFVPSSPIKNYIFSISDNNGNLILSKQINSSEAIINFNVDVHELKQGVYLASITNGINCASKTFLKE